MSRSGNKGFDVTVQRFRATTELVGGDCLLMRVDRYEDMRPGVEYNAHVSPVPDGQARSYEQLKLYWSACQVVAENTDDRNWDTKAKVDELCKIAARHYEYFTYYENKKTGEMTLHIKTRSISFANLAHIEACGYFDEAFKTMAEKLKISVDELIDMVKSKNKGGA